MSTEAFNTMRKNLVESVTGSALDWLAYMGTDAALAAIPDTNPPRYVVAGTLADIVKLLPATEAFTVPPLTAPAPLADKITVPEGWDPDGFVLLQRTNGKASHAACMTGRFAGWLMSKHPDGQWVSERKLEPWELMQAEDQRDDGIVHETNQAAAPAPLTDDLPGPLNTLLQIAEFMESSSNQQQVSVDEWDYASKFDYELSHAASEIRSIVAELRDAAEAAPAPQQSMLTAERIEELFMPMMPWLPSKHGLQQFARAVERETMISMLKAADAKIDFFADQAAPAAPVQTAEPKRIPDMLTVETIQGAIAFGRMGINPPPSTDHWGNEFWQIGRQLAKLSETSAWDNVTPVDVAAPVQAEQAQADPSLNSKAKS